MDVYVVLSRDRFSTYRIFVPQYFAEITMPQPQYCFALGCQDFRVGAMCVKPYLILLKTCEFEFNFYLHYVMPGSQA